IRQRARKNFSLGYNCAECVFEAVISLVDTELPEEVKKIATGFGGGIGKRVLCVKGNESPTQKMIAVQQKIA
ncbi:unnamed protein product, partial [marine sediment metagenome]